MPAPLRVAFVGLAHSHPNTDALNLLRLGAHVVAVHDRDRPAMQDFAATTGAVAVGSIDLLWEQRPDLIIATPRPDERIALLTALGTGPAPVFFNKVIAATFSQLEEWDRMCAHSQVEIGTSSVLRFAPALGALRASIGDQEVLGIRVRVQHDNASFQSPGREWQDDPEIGGGTMITVGVHAWELIDAVVPGAQITSGTGWVRWRAGTTTRSEDLGAVDVSLNVPGTHKPVPAHVLVSGLPGPGAYGIEIATSSGIHAIELDTSEEAANRELGFEGLAEALMDAASNRCIPGSWAMAHAVVRNTVRAASIARSRSAL